MKRKEPLDHLKSYGCELLREGGRHSWWWNPEQNRRSSVPRHTEIKENLAKKI
ncbi:MAG: type II toxin-antitoxin system HicA family toxin [Deltaproteobacteria bacterium]|nr:type II toxin-antitoxin system HicA family toxin [Deltaproteobacteria bacterium]